MKQFFSSKFIIFALSFVLVLSGCGEENVISDFLSDITSITSNAIDSTNGENSTVVTSNETQSDNATSTGGAVTSNGGTSTGPDIISTTPAPVDVVITPNSNQVLALQSQLQLSVDVSPASLDDKSVTWSSNNPSVATVSSTGLVTSTNTAGIVTITATSNHDNNVSASVNITVRHIDKIVFSPSGSINIEIDSEYNIVYSFLPEEANHQLTWHSSNPEIAYVRDGIISGYEVGQTTITATSTTDSYVTNSFLVNVGDLQSALTSFRVVGADVGLDLIVDDVYQLDVEVAPYYANSEATFKAISGDLDAIELTTSGEVKAVKQGVVVVSGRPKHRPTYPQSEITITVTDPSIPTDIYISENDIEDIYIKAGETVQLHTSIEPADADPRISWYSDDPSLALVSNTGLVKGLAEGEVMIVAHAKKDERINDVIIITIEPAEIIEVVPETIETDLDAAITLNQGHSAEINATIAPSSMQYHGLTYSSQDPAVAIVEDGIIKAIGAGTTVIDIFVNNYPEVDKSISVTVNASGDNIAISNSDQYVHLSQTKDLTVISSADDINWISDNPQLATINSEGRLTALATGIVKIKAYSIANPSLFTNILISIISEPTARTAAINYSDFDGYGEVNINNQTFPVTDSSNEALDFYLYAVKKRKSNQDINFEGYNGYVRNNAPLPLKSLKITYAQDSITANRLLDVFAGNNYDVATVYSSSITDTPMTPVIDGDVHTYTFNSSDTYFVARRTQKNNSFVKSIELEFVKGVDISATTPVADLAIDTPTKTTLEVNEELNLTATLSPADAYPDIVWVSDDKNIAEVDYYSGKVKGKSGGKVHIRVYSVADPSFTAAILITVNPKIAQLVTLSFDENDFSGNIETNEGLWTYYNLLDLDLHRISSVGGAYPYIQIHTGGYILSGEVEIVAIKIYQFSAVYDLDIEVAGGKENINLEALHQYVDAEAGIFSYYFASDERYFKISNLDTNNVARISKIEVQLYH